MKVMNPGELIDLVFPTGDANAGAVSRLNIHSDEMRQQMVSFYRSHIRTLYTSLGADEGKCKSCGRAIWWVVTKNGKKAPFTVDGLNHFADCENAKEHRRAHT